ncbi:MAG TPA: rhodanese-like domain-containing protein [Longimicrobiales bacterium]
MPRSAMDLVGEAKRRIENLSVEQAAREIAAGALLVDLRESEERREHGTIPGAVHMPRGMLEFYADPTLPYHRPELDPGRRIILHCASGGRSALAADLLQQMGYNNVAHLDGGLKAWKEAGQPIERADV